jgi:hypothetical protein
VAQLGARLNGIQKVRGSIPLSSTSLLCRSPAVAPVKLILILLIFWVGIIVAFLAAQRSIRKKSKDISDRRRDIIDRMRRNKPVD